jgi:ParB-like chromosome segregation protein Spo0J
MISSVEGRFLEIALSELGQSYGRLRLVHPQADACMVDSLRQFGQISPVVVTSGERYELVDGFKRLRALKQLGYERVTARVLDLSVHGLKAAMIDLNRKKGSICDLEEGLVVHSLCREDGLSQVEAAVLLGRHKSWVCRRLSLIERLCDEALSHIRLGLIPTSIGRELCRLPRGNQPAALRTILKYRFCSRESARLVSLLRQRPRWEWQTILNFPEQILSERTAPRRPYGGLSSTAGALVEKLLEMKRCFSSMAHQYDEKVLMEFTREDLAPVGATVEGVESVFKEFKGLIDRLRQTEAFMGIW